MSAQSKALNATSKEPLRLGLISFLNALPFYHGWQSPLPVAITFGTPTQINTAMQTGLLDVALVSSLFYLNHTHDYSLLPVASISATGPVASVLWVGKAGQTQPPKAIAVPETSKSSIGLLKWLLEEDGIDPNAIEWSIYKLGEAETALQQTGSLLTIGDEALLLAQQLKNKPEDYFIVDLGQAWVEKMGLPFVFAVWVASAKAMKDRPTEVLYLVQSLKANLGNNLMDETALQSLLTLAQQKKPALSAKLLKAYYQSNLNFNWTEAHQQGLEQAGRSMYNKNQPKKEPISC